MGPRDEYATRALTIPDDGPIRKARLSSPTANAAVKSRATIS
jgi:hypothetical protein